LSELASVVRPKQGFGGADGRDGAIRRNSSDPLCATGIRDVDASVGRNCDAERTGKTRQLRRTVANIRHALTGNDGHHERSPNTTGSTRSLRRDA